MMRYAKCIQTRLSNRYNVGDLGQHGFIGRFRNLLACRGLCITVKFGLGRNWEGDVGRRVGCS